MRTLVVIGAISLLGQVVLLREITVTCFGSELVYLLAMGLWLLGSAGGALLGRQAVSGVGRSGIDSPSRRVAPLLLAGAVVLPLLLIAARGARTLLGGVPGAYLPFTGQLLAMAIVVLPYAVLCGLLFRRAALVVMARDRSLAAAYAADCGGALLGGAVSMILLATGFSNLAACLLCALAAAVTAGLLAAGTERRRRSAGFALTVTLAVSLAVALAAGVAASARLDRALTRWNHPHLLATVDTPYGRLTAAGREGQVALFVNDALAYENQCTSAEVFVHVAALQRAAPRRILVLGGGWEDLPREAARYGPDRLVHVEHNRGLLQLQTEVGVDAPVDANTIVADPRRYLREAGIFDLILVGMPAPESGLDNRYYTREFFAACKDRLAARGVLSLRLGGSENLWTPVLTQRNASVYRALRAVFSHVVVLPGATNVFLASATDLPAGADVAGRLEDRQIGGRFELRQVSPAYVRYLYENDRFAQINTLLAASAAPANTDARPSCYRHTLVLWLAKFYPRLGWQEQEESAAPWRRPWVWLAVAVWLALTFVLRGGSTAGRSLAVGAAAAAGMVLEMVLILYYQVRVGALFQDLGLLLTLFMLGLMVGAAGMQRLRSAAQTFGLGLAPWLALASLAGATAILIAQAGPGSLPIVGLLLIGTGAAVGGVFAQMSWSDRPERLVGPLYGADLLAGGLGSLAAGLYLIPVWGLSGTAAAAAVVAGLAAAPHALRRR
ncbi:MAG: hypothetical protein PHQ53_00630 [Candidatus Krumholzibacteria bacterium]|nr:hypothetical protein [Candidatus Krumholzibacteria bacterium]